MPNKKQENKHEPIQEELPVGMPETEPPAEVSAQEETSEVVAQLQKELATAQDQLLRLAAEFDNFRRRSKAERENIYADATGAVASDFLPVLDNFERAAEIEDASYEDYKTGVEMIYNGLRGVFEKLQIEAFGEPGEAFDPAVHNACAHMEDESLPENVVAEVFQKGYRLKDRILRHATVKVAN